MSIVYILTREPNHENARYGDEMFIGCWLSIPSPEQLELVLRDFIFKHKLQTAVSQLLQTGEFNGYGLARFDTISQLYLEGF